MKRWMGTILIAAGFLLLAGAVGLWLHNNQEQEQAAEAVDTLMPQIVEAIQERQSDPAHLAEESAAAVLNPEEREMTVVEIDGYGYVGFLSIPVLGLELPVMSQWSYPQLQISPCRYMGSIYSDDLVVMAHNYDHHFGRLKDLRMGDEVIFTDMDGNSIYYEVAARDVLDPTATEEMTAGEYDLTLFTCTYGGQSRVTVRCDRMEE